MSLKIKLDVKDISDILADHIAKKMNYSGKITVDAEYTVTWFPDPHQTTANLKHVILDLIDFEKKEG